MSYVTRNMMANKLRQRFPGFSSVWMWLFLFASLWLAVHAALKIRPFSLPDESAHYFRTLEVSRLHLINFRGDAGVDIPCEEYKVVGNANGPIANYVNVDPLLEMATPEQPCLIRSINTAGAYSPVMYVFSATGFAIADHLGLDYVGKHTWGRVFNAVANTIIIFLALCLVNRYRPLLAAAAFVPMGFWLRSSLSADAVTDAVLLLYICWLVHCLERSQPLNRSEIITTLALSVLVGSIKPLYSLLPFTILMLFSNQSSFKSQLWLLAPGFVSVVTSTILTKAFDPSLVYVPEGLVPSNQLLHIIKHPFDFVFTLINTLDIDGPILYEGLVSAGVPAVCYAAIIAVLVANTPSLLGYYQRVFLLMMGVALCAAISAALYILYTPPAATQVYGLQGRLFIIPLTLILLAVAFEKKEWMYIAPWIKNVIGYVLPLALMYYCLESPQIMGAMGMV